MKKLIVFGVVLINFFLVSFGLNISPTTGDIESLKEQFGGKILLDEGVNTIENSNGTVNLVSFLTGNNNFLITEITNYNKRININCQNGYIVEISSGSIILWYGKVGSVVLSYNRDTENHIYKSTVTLQCKPIINPSKLLSEKPDINYQSISVDVDDFENYNLSSSISPDLNEEKIKQVLLPGKDVNTQPSFVDILYLQLKTISFLSDSILTQYPNLDFKDLFETNQDFDEYSKWLEKFTKYNSKKQFVDAFSGAVTLKDIGIANDLVKGLFKCAVKGICNRVVNFSHKINDKFDFYSLKEVEQNLYSGEDDIIDNAISYYDNLKSECNNNSITDEFLRNQVDYLCQKLISEDVSGINVEDFDLGYSLGKRVENLKVLKSVLLSGSGFNLRGIFNVYRELNNLTLGTDKIAKIKVLKDISNLTGQYDKLKEILYLDIKELKDFKIPDNSYINNKLDIINFKIKIFTPGTTINKILTSSAEYSSINLFDDNNYEVNNGIVKLKGVNEYEDVNALSTDNNTTSTLYGKFFENSYGFYNDLKLYFSGGNSRSFKRLSQNSYNGKYFIADIWFLREGVYLPSDDIENIKEELNECYEDFIEDKQDCDQKYDNWRNLWKRIKCYKKSYNKYKDYVNSVVRKYDRVIVTCNWFWGGCIGKYEKGE